MQISVQPRVTAKFSEIDGLFAAFAPNSDHVIVVKVSDNELALRRCLVLVKRQQSHPQLQAETIIIQRELSKQWRQIGVDKDYAYYLTNGDHAQTCRYLRERFPSK